MIKTNIYLDYAKKGLQFSYLQKCSRMKFCLTQRSMIVRRSQFFILNFEYLGENKTKFENILTRWSVAHTSSNDEKNRGSKITLDCPFKESLFLQQRSLKESLFLQKLSLKESQFLPLIYLKESLFLQHIYLKERLFFPHNLFISIKNGFFSPMFKL